MRLDEFVSKCLGDLSQTQELLLEHMPAGAVLAKFAFVLAKDVALVARIPQWMAGDDLAIQVNIQNAIQFERLHRASDKRWRYAVAIRLPGDAEIVTDEPFFDPGRNKRARRKRNQKRTFLIHAIQRPFLRGAVFADPGNLA